MTEEKKTPRFKWVKPKEATPEIYTNIVHTTWSLYDVRFQLGQLVPIEPGVSLAFEVEHRGAVTISWPQAKSLRDVLSGLIESYEKTNGEIKPLKLTPAPEILLSPATKD